MNRLFRTFSVFFLATAAALGLGLVAGCNIAGSGPAGATGSLNLFLTDAPTDDWEQVTVVLKSIALHRANSTAWETVWTADPANPAAGKINLVELNGVAEFLKQATIPVGSYNMMRIVIDTDPATMTLVPDGAMAPIAPADIKVVDPSGRGEIRIGLDPAIAVEEGGTANLMVDFDLAHPLSIVVVDGKVVVSLKIRHRPLPRRLMDIQFARTIGAITAAAGDLTTFTVKTLRETEVTFQVNASTIYYDVDAKAPGSFTGLSALVGTGAALVSSNMNADGSLYARRVWYASSIDVLPRWTPEGLVRRVGDTWLTIVKKRTEVQPAASGRLRCDWTAETVFVDENTRWTYRDVDMGAGTGVLRHIARGFRVEVTYSDIDVYPRVAAAINVRSAHHEGLVVDPTLESFGLGWFRSVRTMYYSEVADHGFGWWFYGADASRSTDKAAFIEAAGQARQAHLWVFAWAALTWDQANGRWAVEHLVLAPLRLHELTRITTGYTASTGSMVVSTYDCWDAATPTDMTVKLDREGDLQTVVASVVRNAETNIVTTTVPVPPDSWESVLTPAVTKVMVWVRPQKETDGTYAWHAYTVLAFTLVR